LRGRSEIESPQSFSGNLDGGVTMSKAVKIGDRLLGGNQPCYIVAEVGINHNGSLDLAKQLIDAAADAGCDAVKFQKRTIEVENS
jgi:hypothetical protein